MTAIRIGLPISCTTFTLSSPLYATKNAIAIKMKNPTIWPTGVAGLPGIFTVFVISLSFGAKHPRIAATAPPPIQQLTDVHPQATIDLDSVGIWDPFLPNTSREKTGNVTPYFAPIFAFRVIGKITITFPMTTLSHAMSGDMPSATIVDDMEIQLIQITMPIHRFK